METTGKTRKTASRVKGPENGMQTILLYGEVAWQLAQRAKVIFRMQAIYGSRVDVAYTEDGLREVGCRQPLQDK